MRGWFKLIETIRKTDPPSSSNEYIKPSTNSNITASANTNGHASQSPSTINFDHFSSESPTTINLPSTPIETFDDIPAIEFESPTKVKGKWYNKPT